MTQTLDMCGRQCLISKVSIILLFQILKSKIKKCWIDRKILQKRISAEICRKLEGKTLMLRKNHLKVMLYNSLVKKQFKNLSKNHSQSIKSTKTMTKLKKNWKCWKVKCVKFKNLNKKCKPL